eukprot:TRINITY_DN14158_c0_g4_i1.p1 TRINITY_DN14158_c0_g4~~TRINITY_DN14158_c0_g4_i1.p1  ORF type:complete len:1337 (+),score=297.97 TRINITY_DN14158_c0_g4_i1:256-4011(+)
MGVDSLLRSVKLGFVVPKRWIRLFTAAAQRREEYLTQVQEAMYLAVALDDAEELGRLKADTTEKLWRYWAYDQGLNERAAKRTRPELYELLPTLFGEDFPALEELQAKREAMDARPAPGSKEAIFQCQRGLKLIGIVRHAFERTKEIDLMALGDELNCMEAGEWQESNDPANGVNFGTSDGEYAGWRPLHFVAGCNHAKETAKEAAEKLIEAKADCMLPDATGATALHIAAMRGHNTLVEVLLEWGAPVELPDKIGATALLVAARSRECAVVRTIVRWVLPDAAGAAILDTQVERAASAYSQLSGTQMLRSIAVGDLTKARFLIERGDGKGDCLANVNFADSNGQRAVHVAADSVGSDEKAVEMLRALVYFKADIDARDLKMGETALHVAARKGRTPVVKALLRLKAHPMLPDIEGKTPLMLAASPPGHVPPAPVYGGVAKNKPLVWNTVQDILEWDGMGAAPGKPVRIAKGYAAQTVNELFGAINSRPTRPEPRRRKATADSEGDGEEAEGEEVEGDGEDEGEEEDEEEDADQRGKGKKSTYTAPGEGVRLKAIVLASQGWDDQRIVNPDGRFHHVDSLQLHKALFHPERKAPKGSPPVPDEKRLRLLWRTLTLPLLHMEHNGTITPRLSELLHYLLTTVLGGMGSTFALLVIARIGVKNLLLPSWESIEETLTDYEDLEERVDALRSLCFRGEKPFRQKWWGSVWAVDEYPREPDHAPWDAFEYVDRDNAPTLNTRGGKPAPTEEAFKGNAFEPLDSAFLWGVVGGMPPPPHRGDCMQLVNRLMVDEATGQLAKSEEACWYRSRTIGDFLLCPLLMEAIQGFDNPEMAERAAKHKDLLFYVVAQMDYMGKHLPKPRLSYKESWAVVRKQALIALWQEPAPRIKSYKFDLPPAPKNFVLADGQAGLLPRSDRVWLYRRHSSVAYTELLRSGVVDCVNDFCDIMVALAAATHAEKLVESFWRTAFGLLLWARGKPLLPAFHRELKRRLPTNGLKLVGPRLMPRGDVIGAAIAAGAKAREESDKRWAEARKKVMRTVGGGECEHCGHVYKLEHLFCGNCGQKIPPQGAGDTGEAQRARLAAALKPPLPSGFTDVLRAEIICENEDAMRGALDALLAPPPPQVFPRLAVVKRREKVNTDEDPRPLGIRGKPESGEEEINFVVVDVASSFHGQRAKEVLPRTRSIVLTCRLSTDQAVKETTLQQLVEVELLTPSTKDARWLAKTVGVTHMDSAPLQVRNRPSSVGSNGSDRSPV